LVGVSQALIIPSAQTLSMQDVPEHMAGAAGGVAQTGQRVFTAIGIAIVTGAYFSVTALHGHQTAMVVAAALIAVLMLSSILAAVYSARRTQPQPT
ncbi:MAG TPA: MFS transporter, partial [Candidatus Nesterenkonia stercoripullorum]|nr:MFS transporter [Candidatus Nesterenkonia stercoripullorum]